MSNRLLKNILNCTRRCAAHSEQQTSASAFSGVRDPLFDGGRTQYPETDIVAAKVRMVAVAYRRAHEIRIIEPGTTVQHAGLTRIQGDIARLMV